MDAFSIAIADIKRHEGLRLEAYPDPASARAKLIRARAAGRRHPVTGQKITEGDIQAASGAPWTVGYGATGPEIVEGTVWTREQAERDLEDRVLTLDDQIDEAVLVEIGVNMKAALLILGYNIGIGRFDKPETEADEGRGLRGSTLVERLNAGDVEGAADQFLVWNKAGGAVMPGLVTRRHAERALFLTPDDDAAAAG